MWLRIGWGLKAQYRSTDHVLREKPFMEEEVSREFVWPSVWRNSVAGPKSALRTSKVLLQFGGLYGGACVGMLSHRLVLRRFVLCMRSIGMVFVGVWKGCIEFEA